MSQYVLVQFLEGKLIQFLAWPAEQITFAYVKEKAEVNLTKSSFKQERKRGYGVTNRKGRMIYVFVDLLVLVFKRHT